LTGHFVTTLRFLSEALRDEGLTEEPRFYGLLAGVLRRYQARHPELTARFALFDVFAPNLHRVCINRVRLAIGYSDAAQRPVPIVGSPLENPLWIGERAGLSTLPPSVSAPALEGVA
jgi:aerobactin synthase